LKTPQAGSTRTGLEEKFQFGPVLSLEYSAFRTGYRSSGKFSEADMQPFLWIAGLLVGSVVLILVVGRPLLDWLRRRQARQAVALFRIQREQLEARFFDQASRLGKPRGLKWIECDWQDRVTFGRDVSTGLLTAFVAVNVRFEAIEGGDMEEVAAVGTVRDAAALFHFGRTGWGTGGRALFNMDPQVAIDRLRDQYEPVDVVPAQVASRS